MIGSIKIQYILISSLKALVRNKSYITTYIMIGLLYFLLFFSLRWFSFFSQWIKIEEKLAEAADELSVGGFQPLVMLLTILLFSAVILAIAFLGAVILYTRYFNKQKMYIEEEVFYIKRMLGEASCWISLEHTIELAIALFLVGSGVIFLSGWAFQRLLHDMYQLGAFQAIVPQFKNTFLFDAFGLMLSLAIVAMFTYSSAVKQANGEQLTNG